MTQTLADRRDVRSRETGQSVQERMPAVAAIILNWNRRDDTLACLDSLQDVDYQNLQVILVDNGSTDGTVAAVQQRFPDVEIIRNEANLGYAAGCNVAVREILRREIGYVLLLNNDTVVASDMLTRLVAVAEATPEAGMLGPTIWHFDAPQRLWAGGQRVRPITLSGQPPQGDPHGAQPYEVGYIFGCGLLLRRQLLDDVGLFDERFFMYYEDQDLCRRARTHGYRLLIVPEAKMWHKVSASTGGEGTPLNKYYLARSSVLFYAKHTPRWLGPLIALYRLGSAARTVGRVLRRGQPAVAQAYLRGLIDGLRLIAERDVITEVRFSD